MVFKILHVILLASVKYILTIPYALLIGLSYGQSLIAVVAGGIGGFLFFYYLTNWVVHKYRLVLPVFCKMVPTIIKIRYRLLCHQRMTVNPKRIFTRKSRFIARIRNSYGFWGIIITTPVLLTIPLGAILANKYYSRKKYIVTYMVISIVGWAVILTSLLHVIPTVFR